MTPGKDINNDIIDVELVITKQNITSFYFMNECMNHDSRLYLYQYQS